MILGLIYVAPDEILDVFLNNVNCYLNNIFYDFPLDPIVLGGDLNCRVANLNQLDPCFFQFCSFVCAERSSLDFLQSEKGIKFINNMESNDLILLMDAL